MNEGKMFLVDGKNARFRVKRATYIFDDVLNMNNPKVCVQVRPDVKKGNVRGIHAGSLYSMVDVGCGDGSDGQMTNDWKYEDLVEMVKMKAELREVRRQKPRGRGFCNLKVARI